jgi:phage/plasmid primase-like uncharacterized protein
MMAPNNDKALPGVAGLAALKTRFSFSDIKDSIAGREEQILDSLGVNWESRRAIRCPFPDHEDKSPSWRWNSTKGKYYCSCGHGDVFDVVARILGTSIKGAAQWVMESGYIRTDPELIRAAVEFKKAKLDHARVEEQIAAEEATAADQRRWTEAKEATGTAYSRNKKLFPLGCRQDGKNLLAPLTNDTGRLVAIEYIYPDGLKMTSKGAITAGLSFKIGKPTNGVINICEGVADAWAIHAMTGDAVAAARGSRNLPAVALLLANQYPLHRIVVWADSDAAGMKAADKAQELVDRAEVQYPAPGCNDPWETFAAMQECAEVTHD